MKRAVCLLLLCLPALWCGCRKAESGSKDTTLLQSKKVDAESAAFVAGKKNKIYHRRGCRFAASLDSPVGFASEFEAQNSGRVPCEFCANLPVKPAEEPAAPKPEAPQKSEQPGKQP
ncbi:MAG TPA: hypothetical protein VGP72_13695 [Planctomycetota bacterium]|jgi:hypothetical protein